MLRRNTVPLVLLLSTLACSGQPAEDNITVVPGGGSPAAATAGNSSAVGGQVTQAGTGSATAGTANMTPMGGGGGTAAGGSAPNLSDPNAVIPSAACGNGPPEGMQPANYTAFKVAVTGATLTNFMHPPHERGYYVWIPPDYNNTKPYRIVYIMYGCGNKYAGATATYKLMNEDPQAIYVGMNMPPDGIADSEGTCYNDDGAGASTEWEFFDLMNQQIESNFCVDKNRVYVAGYSSGSWVANMHGCYFSGFDATRKFGKGLSVRGQMAVTGGLPDVPECSKQPVSALWIHDSGDNANPYSGNKNALDRVLAVSKCVGSQQAPWGEGALNSICKQYTDCPTDFPVVFCTTTGRGHDSQNDNAMPAFTAFPHLVDAK